MNRTMSRRGFVGVAAGGLLAAAGGGLAFARGGANGGRTVAPAAQEATGPFTLPPLPYAYEALEPHIDTLTMQIHHDKHHAAYVTNLNKAVAEYPDLQSLTAEDLIVKLDQVPEAIRSAVRNNAGGHVNHTLFWELMAPEGDRGEPGDVGGLIASAFGSLDAFKEELSKAGLGRFGSGWAWLVLSIPDGKPMIVSTPYQDNPLMDGSGFPLLGVDVWEHAYYLKYQNKRADYLAAWWNTVNWNKVNERYQIWGSR